MSAKINIDDELSLKGMIIGFIAGTGATGLNEQKLLFCQNLILLLLNAGWEFTVTFNVDAHTAIFNTKKKESCNNRFLSIMYDPKVDIVYLFCDGETGQNSEKYAIKESVVTVDPLHAIADIVREWRKYFRQ